MAFKGASQSVAMQRAIKRTSDEGIKPAPWAIVAFRVGKDNVGRERVYRRIWSFRDKNKAASAFYRPARGVDLGLVPVRRGRRVVVGRLPPGLAE